jgi:hypothetical protein
MRKKNLDQSLVWMGWGELLRFSNCGYTTDRDVAAAQVVLVRVLAAVGPVQISLTRKCIRNENAENQAPKFLCCQDDKPCAGLTLEAASMCFQCGE